MSNEKESKPEERTSTSLDSMVQMAQTSVRAFEVQLLFTAAYVPVFRVKAHSQQEAIHLVVRDNVGKKIQEYHGEPEYQAVAAREVPLGGVPPVNMFALLQDSRRREAAKAKAAVVMSKLVDGSGAAVSHEELKEAPGEEVNN